MTAVLPDGRPSWQEVVLSFAPPARRTAAAVRRLDRLPFALILLAQGLLSWRLSDVAFNDEALYIDAGHDMIAAWLDGRALPSDYGAYLSGAPGAYPAVAAVLDTAGGLTLVRLFSLACAIAASVCVHGATRHLFGRRPALFAMLAFALSGSVIFVGKFATYDAPCLALLAAALYLTITRRSVFSGIGIGALLALAAATKYTGAVFIPVVLVIGLLTGNPVYRARTLMRAAFAGLTAAELLAVGYLLWGSTIAKGLEFTTTGRRALDYQSSGVLIGSILRDTLPLTLLAAAGLVVTRRRGDRRALAVLVTCVAAGAILPLSQLRIHEFTSLDKHTYFTALFFAPAAGVALDWAFTERARTRIATIVLLWLLLIDGMWRSSIQYSWSPAVLEVVHVVEAHPVPGRYVSVDGDTSRYYNTAPGVRWKSDAFSFALYGQSGDALGRDVAAHRYAGFVFRTGQTSGQHLATVKEMTRLLSRDGGYRLIGRYRTDPYHRAWYYVWQLTPQAVAQRAAPRGAGGSIHPLRAPALAVDASARL